MNTIDALNDYLRRIERALGILALSRGAAATAGAALGATVILAFLIHRNAFALPGLLLARFALFLAIATAVAFGLVIPMLAMNRRRAARRAEQVFPEFEQRLLTLAERGESELRDPFLEFVAAEAEEVARKAKPSTVASRGRLAAFAASAAGATAVLLWLILAAPGYVGEGASLLWAGTPKSGPGYLHGITVAPGNATVRRKTDQWVTASLQGFDTPDVRLFARFRGGSKWEETPMTLRAGGTGYEFLFAALPEDVDYYVAARGVRSGTYKLLVRDLPGVRKLKVTYHYPKWTGLKDKTEDPGGDLRALEGTVADLDIEFDKPVRSAAVAFDNGTSIKLEGDGAHQHIQVPIEHDGTYHFAALEGGQSARLTEDYFIEAQKDAAPMVKIDRPGRDARVSPIEEVAVQVEAEDDFALHEVALHYSVNGGPERTVSLLPRSGAKQATVKTTLYLEDLKLSPGDVVGLFAVARDARNTSQTDIFFLEAQPYDREYTQSQEAGGQGGGMGGDEERMAARQKEVIAATWNQIRDERRAKNAGDDARFLSEVQRKLRDQAQSAADRSKSRELAGTNDTFQLLVRELEEAAKEMSGASDKLKAQALRDALPSEQRALQHLTRAEMAIKNIQVAFGKSQGGQGGGGAARDLENLFDLELDTEKNQYETGQQMNAANQRQQQIDEALQRLEQLAHRQQELAGQQKQKQQAFEQRWQQEQLRREAEELRQRMEQLMRQSSASSQSAQPSQSGQSSQQQSSGDRMLRQAFDRLSRATDDMRQAASQPEQREAGARRAAERLQEAQDILRGLRRNQSSSQLGELGDRSDKLFEQQRQFTEKMRQAFNGQPASDPRGGKQETQRLASEKEQMARDLDRLQTDVQRAARALQGSQPQASGKLREGLSDVQQNEVQLRMKYAANWIRNGRGGFLTSGEALTTASLGKLRDQVRDAQQLVDKGGDKKQPGGDQADQALRQVEKAREGLERAAGQSGEQPGQAAGSRGGLTDSAIRQARRDLTQLRQQFSAPGDMNRVISDAIRQLDRFEKLPLAGPEMDARIQREILPALEQIELQLRRKVEESKGGARNSSAERIPSGYADRVADYFRRLSRAQ
jgi:hypothetical protein